MQARMLTVLLFALVGLMACGGGGGGDSSSGGGSAKPSLFDLVGTYRLESFSVTDANGQTVTQNDISIWSGTMSISANGTIEQFISVNGSTGHGIYYNVQIIGSSFYVASPSCTYNLPFSWDGTRLITRFAFGTCGTDYSETDTWIRVSTTVRLPILPPNIDPTSVPTGPVGGLGGRAMQ